MDTTILIPTFNHEKTIRRAFRSVVSQTCFRHCEIVISDDASADRSYELASELESGHPNVIARRNDVNLGVMAHYRMLLASVQTEYVAILEGDDKWMHASKISDQRALLAANPGMGCCFTAYYVFYESMKLIDHAPRMAGSDRYQLIFFPELLQDNLIGSFTNCMYRTEVVRGVLEKGGDRVGYDWLANLEIADAGPIGYVPILGAQYNVHQNGMWSRLNENEQKKMIVETLQELASSVKGLNRELTLLKIERLTRQ